MNRDEARRQVAEAVARAECGRAWDRMSGRAKATALRRAERAVAALVGSPSGPCRTCDGRGWRNVVTNDDPTEFGTTTARSIPCPDCIDGRLPDSPPFTIDGVPGVLVAMGVDEEIAELRSMTGRHDPTGQDHLTEAEESWRERDGLVDLLMEIRSSIDARFPSPVDLKDQP